MKVIELREGNEPAWDEFVWHSPAATPYHLVGWKRVVEKTYGYPSHYLMAKEGGRIEGVLPLFEVRSRLVGHYLTTLYRGLCTENNEVAQMLVERAKEITIRADARYLVFRDSPQKWDAGLVSVEGYYTAIRDLPSEVESVWKSLDRDTRRQVRRARRNDLQITVGRGECLDDFYGLFSRFARDVGTPVFSKKILQNIIQELPDLPLVFLVWRGGEVIGAYWAFVFKKAIFGAWGASSHRYLSLGPEYLAYWEHLRYGCEHGYRRVDFGRCLKDSGHYLFKRKWASQFLPLYQQHFLNGPTGPLDILELAKTDPKYRLFTSLWRRLPVQVAQLIGPRIRRHLPFV